MMTRSTSALASLAVLCGLCLFPPACAETLDARCAEGACDPRDGASNVDVVTDGGPDAPVDPCIDNPTDPKCLDESKSLFVSGPKGNDQDATGSQQKPFKTVAAALAKLTNERRRLYICTGTYPEDVLLTAAHAGVTLLGGLDCEWAVSKDKPVIGKSANPLKIDSVPGQVAIVSLAFEAKDAAVGSSIGAFINASTVTLKNVRLVAGAGGPGDKGTMSAVTYPDPMTTLKGNETVDNTGALEKVFTCPGGSGKTVGARGGGIGFQGDDGSPGPPNKGLIAACGSMGAGGDGATGKAGALAAGGASLGVLGAAGWTPQGGKPGESGGPGQGGGGGFGSGGGGGGGGAGGCGGAGGGGGPGGGGSAALVAVSAAITVSDSALESKRGGAGGEGVSGQTGQTEGGKRGNGTGCPGGVGGPGGDGSGGAGGAGGISVAILYIGSKPTTDGPTEAALRVGSGGMHGAGADGNDGADGTTAKVLEVK